MDSAIVQVVENVWNKYDADGSGQLDRAEATAFVMDSLTQMNTDKQEQYEFREGDFEVFFRELDKDNSGTIEKEEMFVFIQRVINGEIDTSSLLKGKDDAAEREAELERAREAARALQLDEMNALVPLTKQMDSLAAFLGDQKAKHNRKGLSLLQHIKRVFKILVKHYPSCALEKVEEVSYLLKNADAHHIEEFLKIEDKRNYDSVAQSMANHIATVEGMFAGPKAPEDDPDNVPEVGPVGMVQNLAADAKVFQWAGIGFGEGESYLLQKSLKNLAGAQSLTNVRVWGKILGTTSDYYVVETDNNADEEAAAGDEEGGEVDMEAKGTGANLYAYYVASDACGAWTKLPDVQPKELEASRQISVLLTGDLERNIITNPFFFGKEKNYLRA